MSDLEGKRGDQVEDALDLEVSQVKDFHLSLLSSLNLFSVLSLLAPRVIRAPCGIFPTLPD